MPIHIGFTGTRERLDDRQLRWLKDEMVMLDLSIRLVRLQKPILHHGDCKGADAAAHEMARALGWDVHIHPPLNNRFRAFCEDAQEIAEPKSYLARNRDIVKRSSIILGIPGTPLMVSGLAGTIEEEDVGSGVGLAFWRAVKGSGGTWYTVMQGLVRGREVKVCSPL